jgi:hypothetical protein
MTLFICKIDKIGLWTMLFSWHFENWKRKRNFTSKTKKKEKKATDQKQNEPKYILVEDQLSPFFFLFLSAYFYVVQYTHSSA